MTRASLPAATSTATVLSGSTALRSNVSAPALRIRSRAPPSASSTVRREAPNPACVRSRASAAGASPSVVSAKIRARGCSSGRTRSSERPLSANRVASANGQPSRAAARLKADGAGTATISLAATLRAKMAPIP